MFLASLWFLSGCAKIQEATNSDITLRGEVFVVTKGSVNVRLGRVPVYVYEVEALTKYLASRRDEQKGATGKLLEEGRRLEQEVKNTEATFADYKRSHENAAYYGNQEARAMIAGFERVIADNKDAQDKVTADLLKMHTEAYYFENLPQPLALVRTDSNGAYQINLPNQKNYVVVATAEYNSEPLYWVVRAPQPQDGPVDVTLSNDNLVRMRNSEMQF